MRALLLQYFNIAFLMGKPQDLPGGRDQMTIGVALAMVSYVLVLAVPYGASKALLQAVMDLGFTALTLYIALSVVARKSRFEQAFGGLCGASLFINLATLPLYVFRPQSDGASGDLSVPFWPYFVLLVWMLSLYGHIIRHTFQIGMLASNAAAFVYYILLSSLIFLLSPDSASSTSEVSGLNPEPLFTLGALVLV